MNNFKIKLIAGCQFVNKKTPRGVKDGLIAILFGLILGTIFISIMGYNPFNVFYIMLTSWTKTSFMIGDLIAILSFYLLAASASLIASKAGIFNIGIGAQMMMGGVVAFIVAINTDLSKVSSIFVSLLIASMVGALIAFLIILLKIFFNIHEVLSSIMINWIAFYIYKWIFNSSSKWYVSESLASIDIDKQDSLKVEWLDNIFPNSQISLSIFIAIIVIFAIFIIMKFTVFGRSIAIVGNNTKVGKYAGINVKLILIKVMILSGAIAGISGVALFFGNNQNIPYFKDQLPGDYFNAIAVAMLGANNPIGVIFAGLIFSMIVTSQDTLGILGLSFEISQLLISVIMYSIALSSFFQIYHPISWIKNHYKKKKEIYGGIEIYIKAKENKINEGDR